MIHLSEVDFFSHDEFNLSLYGVFDGFLGSQTADFAKERLPVELVLGQLSQNTSDDTVKDVLRQAFLTVDREYFVSINDALARLFALKMDSKTTDNDRNLQRLELQPQIGASATVAIVLNHKLFVANVGDTRAIVCDQLPNGELKVIRLSVDHVIGNEDEDLRLCQIGINAEACESAFGPTGYTRCLGLHKLKGGYKDVPPFENAKDEPVLSDPEIHGGIELKASFQFLLIFSRSLVDCLTQIVSIDSGDIMKELCKITMEQFQENNTITGVAQSVVDKIVRMHREQFEMESGALTTCTSREDISFLVRNFGAKLAERKKSSTTGSSLTNNNVDFGNNTVSNGMMPARRSEDTITTENTTISTSPSEVGPKSDRDLPMDENGRIKPYVDFSHFNQEWAKHLAATAETKS